VRRRTDVGRWSSPGSGAGGHPAQEDSRAIESTDQNVEQQTRNEELDERQFPKRFRGRLEIDRPLLIVLGKVMAVEKRDDMRIVIAQDVVVIMMRSVDPGAAHAPRVHVHARDAQKGDGEAQRDDEQSVTHRLPMMAQLRGTSQLLHPELIVLCQGTIYRAN
jgi:hypothetical protein